MIKLTELIIVDAEIELSFTPSVKTYNVVTSFMSDACKPYRVSDSTMIWLSEKGELGELECIYPTIADEPLCQFSDKLAQGNGFPRFLITSHDNDTYVQHDDDGFTVWLKRNRVIDTEILFANLIFLISEKELVAISAKKVKLVE